METFVDIISDIGAQISKIKRCRINQQTLSMNCLIILISFSMPFCLSSIFVGGLFLRLLISLKSYLESATKEPFPYG